MRPELDLLRECLEHEDIDDRSAEAFEQWQSNLESGRYRDLTDPQRQWLLNVCRRLGIEPGAENLVSSGAVRVTKEERASLRAFHEGLGPKVLKPPGRRA